MKRLRLFFILFFIIAIQAENLSAKIDDHHYRLTAPLELPLRWDNVEGHPEVIHGNIPVYSQNRGKHLFILEPGQESFIRLPAHEKMRFIAVDSNHDMSDFEVSVSYGSSLFCFLPLKKDLNNKSCLLEPDAPFPTLVCIRRPLSSKKTSSLAVFISRYENFIDFAPYRNIVKVNAPEIKVYANHKQDQFTFYKVIPHSPIFIKTKGHGRLKVEMRYMYSKQTKASDQTFRIWHHIENNPPQLMLFETKPENLRPIFFMGQYQLTSRLEKAYFEIPEGNHILFLRSDSHLLVRILEQERPGYLFESLNSPKLYELDLMGFDSKQFYHDYSSIKINPISQMIKDASTPPMILEQLALKLCRNNMIRSSGLTGSMLLSERHELLRKYPELRFQANKIYFNHTFYRNALPDIKQTQSFQQSFTFLSKGLKKYENCTNHMYIFDQLMQKNIKTLPEAFFSQISSEKKTTYHIPDHATPGFLRIIVSEPFKQEAFFLKRGDMAPILFQTRTCSKISSNHYQVETNDIYMGLQNDRKNKYENISGSALDIPDNYVQAEIFELYLPENIKTIQVWQDKNKNNPSHNTYLALQYRDAKKFKWSATEFLNMCPFISKKKITRHLLSSLTYKKYEKGKLYPAEQEFIQYLKPLYRFLLSRASNFSQSAAAQLKKYSGLADITISDWDWNSDITNLIKHYIQNDLEPRAIDLFQKAMDHEKNGHDLTAIEIYSQVFFQANSPLKEYALFKQIELFQKSGDLYIAKELLRGILVYDLRKSLRKKAFEHLKMIYETNHNHDALISLYAFAASQNIYHNALPLLLPILLEAGYKDIALLLCLMLEESAITDSGTLSILLKQNWHEVFNKRLDHIRDQKEKKFWNMQMLLNNGHYEDARKLLANCTSQDFPPEYYNHVKAGFLIQNKLFAFKKNDRLNAILEWEKWQMSHPGPSTWENANAFFVDFYGTRTIYSPKRDLYSQFYMANEQNPITIQVMGPAELLLEMRPLHTNDSIQILEGWVSLHMNHEIDLIPILRNMKTFDLEILGHENENIGQKVTKTFKIKAGLHQIKICSSDFPLLTNLYIKRPQNHHSVLPFITPQRIVQRLENPSCSIFSNRVNSTINAKSNTKIHIIGSQLNSSIESISDNFIPQVPFISPKYIQQQIEEANHLLNKKRDSLTKSRPKSSFAFKKNSQGNIEIRSENNIISNPYNKMLLLAYNAENENILSKKTILETEQLFYQNRMKNFIGFKSLYNKIAQKSAWEKIESIIASAGIRYIEINGWVPESPYLRKRKILIQGIKPYDHMLSDDSELILSTYLLTSKSMQINFCLVDIGFNDILPLKTTCQINNQDPYVITLTKDSPRHVIKHSIDSGNHFIKIKNIQSVENQLLKINVTFSKHHVSDSSLKQDFIVNQFKRSYHIASWDEPIEFEIKGPAWLRIDELRNGLTYSRYQAVKTGFKVIQIFPEKGQDEGLFRIFYKAHKKSLSQSTIRSKTIESHALIKPFIQIPSRKNNQTIVFQDKFTLGGQEDGTFSFMNKMVSRKNINEDDSILKQRDNFIEIASTYRNYNPFNQTYYYANILGRQREYGGPLIGFEGKLFHFLECFPMNMTLKGVLYFQQPNSSNNNNIEWRSKIDGKLSKRFHLGPKVSHLTYVSGFAQILSMADMDKHTAKNVGQDIFTQYKLDHQLGLTIGDSFTYHPFMDSKLKASISLTTNEDKRLLDPDHIKLNAQLYQFLNPFIAEIRYGFRWYLSDKDRHHSLTRNTLGAKLTWEHWQINRHRLEAIFDISHDFESSNTIGSIIFQYHLGKARMYRDFINGEMEFFDLRQRKVFYKQ